MRCPTCSGPLTLLFYSSVCDACERGEHRYYSARRAMAIGPYYWSRLYVNRDDALVDAGHGGRVDEVTIDRVYCPKTDYLCYPNDPSHNPPGDVPIARYVRTP